MDDGGRPQQQQQKAPPVAFAYQQRLLDSRLSRQGSLSRSGSISSLLSPGAGSSSPSLPRRLGHRVGQSLDIRRSREDDSTSASSPLSSPPVPAAPALTSPLSASASFTSQTGSGPRFSSSSSVADENTSTPRALKRQTMPSHLSSITPPDLHPSSSSSTAPAPAIIATEPFHPSPLSDLPTSSSPDLTTTQDHHQLPEEAEDPLDAPPPPPEPNTPTRPPLTSTPSSSSTSIKRVNAFTSNFEPVAARLHRSSTADTASILTRTHTGSSTSSVSFDKDREKGRDKAGQKPLDRDRAILERASVERANALAALERSSSSASTSTSTSTFSTPVRKERTYSLDRASSSSSSSFSLDRSPSTSTATSTYTLDRAPSTSARNRVPKPSEIRAQFEAQAVVADPSAHSHEDVHTPRRRPASVHAGVGSGGVGVGVSGGVGIERRGSVEGRWRPDGSGTGFGSGTGDGVPHRRTFSQERVLGGVSGSGRPISPEKERTSTSSTGSFSSLSGPSTSTPPSPTTSHTHAHLPTPTPSIMTPAPYTPPPRTTTTISGSKKHHYADSLSHPHSSRALGRHLPRIASGDADDDWVADDPAPPPVLPAPASTAGKGMGSARVGGVGKVNGLNVNGNNNNANGDGPPPATRSRLERRLKGALASAPAPSKPDLLAPTASDVTGVPGRLRLSRQRAPLPLPSAKMRWGLWADTQRHLLQAYEYLCHVGEAQQWIEGCLREELGFGVVEMEEGLRNGAVLAKLVRVFVGEGKVPRIYETPYPDWRHSDNVNYFFLFVRDPEVGLPESFIFEFTDLYNKKNLPKVIYCIHALSHLLARRGKAQRIGNLLGQLQFSDDQLERTQKGLKDAGVAMPNFGSVGRALAVEMDEQPEEEEEETEEERRDRLLLENEASVAILQSVLRGSLVRKAEKTRRGELRLAERYVLRLQAHARGALARKRVADGRRAHVDARPFARALQAHARGIIVRRTMAAQLARVDAHELSFVGFQAHARGALVRQRFGKLRAAVVKLSVTATKMQALGRARLVRRYQSELQKVYTAPAVSRTIARIQACARGVLRRRAVAAQLALVDAQEATFVKAQAQLRGILVRRRVGRQLAKLDDAADIIVRIQAFFRSYLARKRLLALIRGLRRATPLLVLVQARARAGLARQRHAGLAKALERVEVVTSVGGFQALARAAIMRNRHREQAKRLEFAAPDVTGLQAAVRGALFRREWTAWRDHVRRSEPVAVHIQALLRGVQRRREFQAKMRHYRENMDKVVKIQSLFRAKETRDQYRQLTLGTNVSVGTIKNFVHLLNDSETDFQEEVDLERMRKEVVERIRANQALERDVNELDIKIALVVNNAKTFEELKEARRRHGGDTAAIHAARASVLAAHGDPFAGPSTLDHGAKRKLELYQQLFYVLQSRGEYLGRLFRVISKDNVVEKDRRLLERVVLTLFGYGQDRREDFLLLKAFQYAIVEEVNGAKTVEDVLRGPRVWINIALHYLRQKQSPHLKETLAPLLRDIGKEENLDMEVDPTVIFRARMEQHEMRLGHQVPANQKNVNFHEALEDLNTRAEYIRHLQVLRWWTEAFVNSIVASTRRMPYAIRYLAREMLGALQAKFPDAVPQHAACLGRLVYYRYINPAVITPETFHIVNETLDIGLRRNLAQVSKVITQITTGVEFDDCEGQHYVAINEYVRKAIKQVNPWVFEVASVPDLETQYHAHDFLDATVQPKPIYISPNEVYAMHGLLAQYLDQLAPMHDDPLRVILHDLDGVPNLGSAELTDARDRAITLELTNRFANVKDLRAEEKTLWIQAKRTVLAILRVQPGKDLVESLMQPVTDEHEEMWEEVLENEMEADSRMGHPRRMPSAMGQESAYRLEDIRQLSFREVKAHAIYFLLELEKQGKVSRGDGYQGILNAIANDVRSKHRMRLQRQQEIDGMAEAIRNLSERKKHFMQQIKDYNDYVEQSMATMQRGKNKKRLVLPFSKQFFHQRDLAKAGSTPQFGSFKYSAADLYDRSILISIDGFSPIQFNKIDVIISSDKLGVFTVEIFNGTMGAGMVSHVGKEDVKMQDLLQLQFESKSALPLFNGAAKFNLDLLLYQINKKFYV